MKYALPEAEETPDEPATEPDKEASDSQPRTDDEGAEPTRPNVPRPSSTWQPLASPITVGNGLSATAAPTTGLVGPGFAASPQPTDQPFGAAPTTGLTGPPSSERQLTAVPSSGTGAALPTTGIGTGPINSALPSGLPTAFIPQGGLNAPICLSQVHSRHSFSPNPMAIRPA